MIQFRRFSKALAKKAGGDEGIAFVPEELLNWGNLEEGTYPGVKLLTFIDREKGERIRDKVRRYVSLKREIEGEFPGYRCSGYDGVYE